MKKCARKNCDREVVNNRKKFCSDHCKWWHNSIKRDNEKHLPPVKKRNDNYFHMVTGSAPTSMRGQGKRSGHMVKGGMAAMVWSQTEEIAEVNYENLNRHFNGNNFGLTRAKLCGGGVITREKFETLTPSL